MPNTPEEHKQILNAHRHELLENVEKALEKPMVALGLVWLVLIVIAFTRGLSHLGWIINNTIWAIFVLDFLLRFVIAPNKRSYLTHNWLTALSLLLPALRVFRFAAALRLLAAPNLELVQVVSAINRGARSLGATMGRRGFGYVATLTIMVTFVGAAGMLAFERPAIPDYGRAVYWTAMVMTTLGSDYWPQTAAGRVLCFLLSLYAFSMFGYITASIATLFVDQDAQDDKAPLASTKNIDELKREIAAMRQDVQQLVALQRATPHSQPTPNP